MKKLILLGLLACLSLTASATEVDTLTENSKITKAIVYYKGATLHREVIVRERGESIIAIKGLPIDIDRKSLTVEAGDQLEIKSVKSKIESSHAQISLTKRELATEHELTDSMELISILMAVLDEEYNMIRANQNFEKDEEITSVEEVKMASEFYQSRVKDLKLERLQLKRKLADLNGKKNALLAKRQMAQAKVNQKEMIVYVHVNNQRSPAKIKINYYSPRASWSPYYDLKAGADEKNLELHRKAFVMQSTTEDWKDIKLTLSTSIPISDNRLPLLMPLRLQQQNPYKRTGLHHNKTYSNGKTGMVIDSNGEPMIGANIILDGTNQGTTTDIDGTFYFPQGIGKNISVHYTGYNNATCRLNGQYNVITLSEGALLDEIVITGRGARKQKIKKEAAPVRKQIELEIKETLNTLSYELSKTYSLNSGSEPTDVLLKIEDLPTLLQYESLPIKNESAYLIAEIEDWHLYNLEPAAVNLFIDGTFKGKSTINPDSQEENLKISLGNDPEISLNRKWINNKYKKKLLSRHKEEMHHYLITVKNNKTHSVKIKVKDQIPISSDESIEIEAKNISGGNLEAETGFINWELELESGESKELELIYKLKYPKNYNINL